MWRPAALVLATVVVAGCAGGRSAPPAPPTLPTPGAAPLGYHITYAVTSMGVVSTEDLWVGRPFESEDESRSGKPPGNVVLSRSVNRLGRQLLTANPAAPPRVLEIPPDAAPFDVRLDAVAPDLIQANLLVVEGVGAAAGRACRFFRSASTLRTTTALEQPPTISDHVDTCVDAEGLILDERTVAGGHLTTERRAVSVIVGAKARPSSNYGVTGAHLSFQEGGGTVVEVTATSEPPGEPFWSLPALPGGFHELGRYAVVHPQLQAVGGGAPLHAPQTSVDDVLVDGPDLVVIEQGPAPGAANGPLPGMTVDLGKLGQGRLSVAAGASSLTAQTGGMLVQVRGTVRPPTLESVARSLTPGPPGTLETIPGGVSDSDDRPD